MSFFSLRAKHRIRVTVAPAESSSFSRWHGTPHNGVAWLALGWAYVLSASLAERQGLHIEYHGEVAGETDGTHHRTQPTVSLPYARPAERRWWRAVTAPGVGWSLANGGMTPWATDVAEEGLGLSIAAMDADVAETPPTARQAARYLARLCAFFRLGSQSSAALAAVLTFPLHAPRHMRDAAPSACHGRGRGRGRGRVNDDDDDDDDDCALPSEFAHLSYYMTFSLSPRVIESALWSVFWAPDVPCHLAGAWIQPAAAVLTPILRTDTGAVRPDANLELLAKVLSGTRAAPLWLGVALCGYGRVVQSIVSYLSRLWLPGHAVPTRTAAAWTGLPICFLHTLPSSLLPATKDAPGCPATVSRAQVWRLRHDFHSNYPPDAGFNYTPDHGWLPFGAMRVDDVEPSLAVFVLDLADRGRRC